MTTTLKTSTQHKLLSVHEKLDMIKMADVPYNFPCEKKIKTYALLCQLKI
jgi:hypothetical protein